MKHLKQFESFSKIYENSGEKTTEEVIAKYQQTPGLWNMAKDQYYNVITGSEMALKELEEYYCFLKLLNSIFTPGLIVVQILKDLK